MRCPTCFRRLSTGARCPEDGASAPARPPVAPPAPPEVPGFDVGGALGAGGFATVWGARRRKDGVGAAIKVAHDSSALTVARMEREAAAVAAIGAPHAPAYYRHGCLADGRPFLAMELVPGETLARQLERAGPVDLARVAAAAHAILTALEAVHDRGWIHRDLKPENVFLGDDGVARLVDFGLAAAGPTGAADRPSRPGDVTRLTRDGVAVGTVEYMAPEQLEGGAVDARADLYAFGVVLYEMLARRPPFAGDAPTIEHGHLALRPVPTSELAGIPAEIDDVVLSCLAKAPDKRPASARAVRRALDGAFRCAGSPSMQRTAARSMLVERAQPVVVLAARGVRDGEAAATAVERFGGFVARRGELAIAVFAGAAVADPAAAALGAARELVDTGAQVALEVGRVALRRRRRGAMLVAGEVVDAPERWLPQAPWTGIVATEAFAHECAAGSAAPGPAGFVAISGVGERGGAALVGRAAELAAAEASLRACQATATPALVTITAGAGLGKTRLAHELGRLARDAGLQVTSIAVPAGPARAAADDRARAAIAEVPAARGHAVIIDEACRLDARTLDAIEYATLDHPARALWVVVIGDDSLRELRPRWGARAHRHDAVALPPLARDDARALVAARLAPAEFIPAAFLDRVAEMAGGNPSLIERLVAELVRCGALARRGHGHGWDVAPAALDAVQAAAPTAWVAARDLEAIAPELAACARVCAVLGSTLHVDELAAVVGAADRAGVPATPMDVDVALRELGARGTLIAAEGGWWAFASELYRHAVYDLLDPDDRRHLHRLAAAFWLARPDGERDGDPDGGELARGQLARHLEATERGDDAAGLHVALGDAARARHRYVDADRCYTAALRCTADARTRCRALAGRGEARTLLHRTGDALDDLRAARELSERLTDPAMTAHLLLAEATAADSAADFAGAAAAATAAHRLIEPLADPRLHARGRVADGRTAWRRGDAAAAIELLTEAIRGADAAGDASAAIDAQVLLAPALVVVGRLDDAERAFADALDRCDRAGDRLHACAAYGNRLYLRSARKDVDGAIADLRVAIQLAREIGNPEPERVATHNLAELLMWRGDLDQALALAERARTLQERFWNDVPHDALLLARVHAARGELAPARALIDWIGATCDLRDADPTVHLLLEALRRLTGVAPAATWDVVVARAAHELPPEERIEVWSLRARDGDARAALDQARASLAGAPIWREHLDRLAAQLPL